ncbi:livM, partial [Symbiodinium necroappetens]
WGVLLLLAFAAFGLPLLAGEYLLNSILVPFLVFSLAAIGLNILTGYCGQLSLGTGGFMACGAFFAYKLTTAFPEIHIVAIFLLAGLGTAFVGILFGIPSLRIKGFYLAVATLAAQFFLIWVFNKFGWWTNYSPSGVISAPPREVVPGVVVTGTSGTPAAKYLFLLGFVAVLALVAKNLVRSRIGRTWMAIRDMDIAAEIIGIRPMYAKLSAFAVSSFFIGIAGALWAFCYTGSVEALAFEINRSFQAVDPRQGEAEALAIPLLTAAVGGGAARPRRGPPAFTRSPGRRDGAEAAQDQGPNPDSREAFEMRFKSLCLAAAGAALLATAATAPAPAAAQEQYIPLLVYKSGPYAPNGIPIAAGWEDYLKLINARDGGVGGVKLVWEECDTGYNNDRGVECYERLKKPTAAGVQPLSTGITYALIDRATQDKIPLFSSGYGRTSASYGPVFPYVFMPPLTYWSGADVIVQYISEQEGGDLSDKKVALVYHDSAYGKEPIATLERLAEEEGFELSLFPVAHPGLEQKATWLQIGRQ